MENGCRQQNYEDINTEILIWKWASDIDILLNVTDNFQLFSL